MHQRPVAFHQCRERKLIGPVPAGQELLDELLVRQVSDDAEMEQGIESSPKASIPESAGGHVSLLSVCSKNGRARPAAEPHLPGKSARREARRPERRPSGTESEWLWSHTAS